MLKKITCLILLLSVMFTAGCGAPPVDTASRPDQVAKLSSAILALGPEVDPEEAERAARITYEYVDQLVQEYEITDPPLIHNSKVNFGIKPRGLCYHWANDIEARLNKENFQTLQMHGAIANAEKPLLLEHSTAIISRRGDTHMEGIVLDPWRTGGVLHWAPTVEDTKYDWRAREEVFEFKRRRQAQRDERRARASQP